jgi:iron complex outermembrane receptor protein
MSDKLKDAIRVINKAVIVCGSLGALTLGASQAAFAQDGVDQIEEVEVVGIRAGLQQALELKRQSNSIVDAISSEDMGKFPDKNVAESLQRVPGVTIQRQFGEGAAVSIRGAGQNFTLTTLNGQNVASTGWFVLEPAKRSFNYELLPSELVGGIEVFKSSQADLSAGGVGGTVVIKTRKPLDQEALSIYGSIEGSYQSDSEETDPQYSGMMSWKNEAEDFGVLVSAVMQQRSLQRQGNEAFWEWGAGPVGFEQERERSALTATFQYQPSEQLEVVLNVMDMEMAADNTNYAVWLTQGNTSWSGIDVPEADMLNGTPVRGPLNVAYYQARPREATMNSDVIDLSVNYSGENYLLELQVGETTSTGGTDFEMVLEDGTGGTPIPGGTYDFSNGSQTWDLNGFDLATYDPGSVAMGTGSNFNRTPKTDEESYFQADIAFDVEFGAIDSIKFGAKWADHNTTSRRFEYIQAAGFDANISTSGLTTGTIAVGSGDYDMVSLDIDAIKAIGKNSIIGETEDLGAYSEIDETNTAVYAMARFESDNIRGNFGVRVVSTEATSTYFVDGVQGSTTSDYTEVLPSFNIAYDVAEDVILRAAAGRTIARPQYPDMYVNPNVTGTNDDTPNNQFWIIGNVGLDPFVSNQFDAGIEWYFAEGSLLSAGFFMKDVKNFVSNTSYHADSADIPFNLPRQDESDFGWTVQEKTSGGAADIVGFELQYQQDFANGFGLIANYTYTDTETSTETFTDGNPILSDSSDNAYNLSGYYESDDFQVRMSYNYRSDYMLRESGAYGNRLHDGFGSLDMSAAWYITDSLDLKLDINNITEETASQFGNDVENSNSMFTGGFPAFEYEMARRISLGLSFKY